MDKIIKSIFNFLLILSFIGSVSASGWHYADEIYPGTFQAGNYAITGDLNVSNSFCLNGVCRSTWPSSNIGDIEGVTAGIGISGGGTTGTVTLDIDPTYVQRRVSSSCIAGQSIRAISEDGTVICEVDTDTNTNAGTICGAGTFLNGDGTCDAVVVDTNSGGDITGVTAGNAITVTSGDGPIPTIAVTALSIDDAEIVQNSIDATEIAADAIGDSELMNGGTWTTSSDLAITGGGGVNGFSVDGTTFSIDSTNNRVGIGTSAPTSKLHLVETDTVADVGKNAMFLNYDISGADVLITDRNHVGLNIDIDSSATGGDTSNEHRVYGIMNNVQVTGDSDLVYGNYNAVRAAHTTETVTLVTGLYSYAQGDNTGGTTSAVYGAYSLAYEENAGIRTNMYSFYGRTLKQATATSTTGTQHGLYAEIESDNGAGVVTTGYGVRAEIDNDNLGLGAAAWGTSYLFYGNYQGTFPSNSYGIYIGDAVPNYFGGDLTVKGTAKINTLCDENGANCNDLSTGLGGGSVGSWDASYTYNTNYQASTDGFVIGVCDLVASTDGYIYYKAYTASSTASYGDVKSKCTVRRIGSMMYNSGGSFMMPVKSGDYWKVDSVTSGTTTGFIYWVPFS